MEVDMKRSTVFFAVFVQCFINSAFAQDSQDSVVEQEQNRLTNITISADPFNHNLLEHVSPVTVIEKKELLLKAQTTIGETLAREPGVSSSYFGPGASRPIIRGKAGDRIRVLKNGLGTQDVSNSSEDHPVSVNPLNAETVEVLRGPETLLFGSSAIGGVANITDNSIPENEIGKDLTGTFDLRGGTADNELTGALKLEGQKDKFNWHVSYFHQDTDDIEIPGFAESDELRAAEAAEEGGEEGEGEAEDNGILSNSATRSQGLTVGSSYIWDKGFIGVSFNGWESVYGVPGHICLLYTSPSPRDLSTSRMPSSA